MPPYNFLEQDTGCKRQAAVRVRAGIFLHLDVVMLSGQGQVGASVITHFTGLARRSLLPTLGFGQTGGLKEIR